MFFKIGVPKNLANFTGKHLCNPTQVFYYEISEIYKNIFFKGWTEAATILHKKD